MLKRTFDILASFIGLLVLSPLLLALAIWIKLDSPGPVFYRGKRTGRGGRPFKIFKFRSMVSDAEKIGGPSTSDDDARVTRSGRFIRRFKLDEISQLLNVLRGEMSLVGPRPEVVDKAAELKGEYARILDLRPGITDWASIWNSDEGGVLAGAPDPDGAYERVIRPTKLRLQLHYCNTRNLLVDLKILFHTAMRIARKGWAPAELAEYPTFEQLRAEVETLISRQRGPQPGDGPRGEAHGERVSP
jgi:lipopolysaccharide/colanic/teichoic acid biosynthesis glycosyltransferase